MKYYFGSAKYSFGYNVHVYRVPCYDPTNILQTTDLKNIIFEVSFYYALVQIYFIQRLVGIYVPVAV